MNKGKTGAFKLSADGWIAIAMMILGAAAIANAQQFPEASQRFPVISCYLLIALSIALLVRSILNSRKARKAEHSEEHLFPWETLKYALITFALTGVYIFLMQTVDFFVATALFVPAMMIFMRVKKKLTIILVTAGTVLFCWFMFVNQLNIRMP